MGHRALGGDGTGPDRIGLGHHQLGPDDGTVQVGAGPAPVGDPEQDGVVARQGLVAVDHQVAVGVQLEHPPPLRGGDGQGVDGRGREGGVAHLPGAGVDQAGAGLEQVPPVGVQAPGPGPGATEGGPGGGQGQVLAPAHRGGGRGPAPPRWAHRWSPPACRRRR